MDCFGSRSLESLRLAGEMPAGEERRCGCEHCCNPDDSSHFFKIKADKKAGGQDWTSLAGQVLCSACYQRFRTTGSLEGIRGPHGQRLSAEERRCGYEHCCRPGESCHFHKIKADAKAGGQDWSSLAGRVLCHTCYGRFRTTGSLEGARGPYGKRLSAEQRRCGYEHCCNPDESSRFHEIKADAKAGGQDWSSLAGQVLCITCYERFRTTGSLEGARGPLGKRMCAEERRCGYEHCCNPDESRKFLEIKAETKAGGQDWASLVGQVLCQTCYCRFRRTGSLDCHISRPSKRQKTSKTPTSSSPPPPHPDTMHTSTSTTTSDDDNDDQHVDTGECLICFDESRTMCIVPCGHYGLCATCGDEDKFNSDERPYSNCPTCREEMCKPYVMSREMWVELGGTVYDTC